MVGPMRAFVIVAAVAALAAVAGAQGRVTPAAPACTSAKIAGKRVCLAVGVKCAAKYASIYKAHGFRCKQGRLAKIPKPKAPAIGTVAARIAVPASTFRLAAGDGAVWALGGDSAVRRIDPATNAVTATVQTAADQEFPHWIAVGGGSLWVSNFTDNTVWRVDASSGARTATIPVAPAPEGIAVAPSGVWVATHRGNPTGSVTRIDPATNVVTKTTAVGMAQDCCGPQGLAASDAGVWTTVPNLNAVVRVDPATGAVAATIPADPACGTVGSGDAMWAVSGCNVGNLYRIDPATNTLAATIKVGGVAADVAVGVGVVWVLTLSLDPNSATGTLVRVDPATNRVVGTMTVPDAAGIAVVGTDVFVGSGHAVWRVKPA